METTEYKGCKIAYKTYGDSKNPAVLLMMGITARGEVWELHREYLVANGYYCIEVDNPGVGLSGVPTQDPSTAFMADAHAYVMEALGISKYHVVGVSMGGANALQMGLRHADKLRSIHTMCPWAQLTPACVDIFELIMNTKEQANDATFLQFIQQLIASPKFREVAIDGFIDGRKPKEGAIIQSSEGLKWQARACIDHDVLGGLGKITTPTLVTGGTIDMFVPRFDVELVAHEIPNSESYFFEGGHIYHWEQLRPFNALMLDWIRDHDEK